MPTKTCVIQYEGHDIEVVNTWFHGYMLNIDGEEKAKKKDLFAVKKDIPFMSASLEINGQEKIIEVYIKAIVFVRIKICVDGQFIGGDNF